MAERIRLGGEYESESGETRQKFWIDVSSSLMNRVNALAIEEHVAPSEVLADVVSGDRELSAPEPDESAADADGDD